MSRAKIGSRAVAPPNRTAKRSRDIAPRISGRPRMKAIPEKRERKSREFELGGTRSKRMKEESRLAKRKSKAAIEYAAVGPAA